MRRFERPKHAAYRRSYLHRANRERRSRFCGLRIGPQIAKAIADSAAAQLERELAVRGRGRKSTPARTRRRREDLTRWIADRNARRVPKFVIQATGLDTKKKLVAKFGPDAVFEKGKPLPKTK